MSKQCEVHEDLPKLLSRREGSRFARPVQPELLAKLSELKRRQKSTELLLDLGAGSGDASLELLSLFPLATVLAVDKSHHRLEKLQSKRSRLSCEDARRFFVLRAKFEDFFAALAEVSLVFDQTFLLYPNPWPKAHHFKRRIYARPYFPLLLERSSRMELRTNWPVLSKEFCYVVEQAATFALRSERLEKPLSPVSAFERKYFDSAHDLLRVTVERKELSH